MQTAELHTKHPILRISPGQRTFVRVGVFKEADADDEVWSRSSKMLRDISEQFEGMWGDTNYWRVKRTMRPWCYRNMGERFLSEIIFPYAWSIRCTILQDQDANYGSQYAERIFDLMVIDGVLRHPAPSEVKGMLDENGRSLEHPKQYDKLFKIVPEELENWIAVRRILLADKRKGDNG